MGFYIGKSEKRTNPNGSPPGQDIKGQSLSHPSPARPASPLLTSPASVHLDPPKQKYQRKPLLRSIDPSSDSIGITEDKRHYSNPAHHDRETLSIINSKSSSLGSTERIYNKRRSGFNLVVSSLAKVFSRSGRSGVDASSESVTGSENPSTEPLTGPHVEVAAAYNQSRALILELAGSSIKRGQLSSLAGDEAQCVVDFLNKVRMQQRSDI